MVNVSAPRASIIAQNEVIVKREMLEIAQKSIEIAQKSINVALNSSGETPPPVIKTEKWAEKQPMKAKMARRMWKIGLKERSERMNNCSNLLEYSYCKECGKVHIKRANLCRDRFCPICSWRLALQRVGEMQRLVECLKNGYPDVSYSLITLTVKNCPVENLSETMKSMSKAWNLALAQRKLRPRMFGWARSTELTYNKRTKEVHPHFHIIMGWKADEDREAAQELIIKEWLKAAAKNDLKVDIKAQDASAIMSGGDVEVEKILNATVEVFKYTVKTTDMESMPLPEFKELVSQFAGKHLCEFGGKFKELKKALKLEMETIEDEDIKINICRDCGSVGVSVILLKWSFGESAYKLFC